MCFSKSKKENVSTMDKLAENFNESTGFYRMTKWHANISFGVAVFAMFAGIVLYAMGFYYSIVLNTDAKILSLVSGSFVELVAGTVFWLHNKCLAELNEFHKRLSSTERYLTAITLVKEIQNQEQKDIAYKWLLENCILTDVEIQTGEILKWRHENK